MDKSNLLKYEMPSWYEYVGIDWVQELLAKRLATKVNRKVKRYEARLARETRLAREDNQ